MQDFFRRLQADSVRFVFLVADGPAAFVAGSLTAAGRRESESEWQPSVYPKTHKNEATIQTSAHPLPSLLALAQDAVDVTEAPAGLPGLVRISEPDATANSLVGFVRWLPCASPIHRYGDLHHHTRSSLRAASDKEMRR